MASYELLVHLFERVDFFLKRLKSYTAVRRLSPEMMVLLVKIIAQVLSVLAISTKVMKQKRISVSILSLHPFLADYDAEQIMKRLAGRRDVEDALQRLDALTNAEGLMAAARTLEVIDNVDADVIDVKEVVHRVGDNVGANLKLTQHVEQQVVETKEVAYEVSKVRSIGNTVKESRQSV